MIFQNTFKIILISLLSLTMWPGVGCKSDNPPKKPSQVSSLTGSLKEPVEPKKETTPEAKAAKKIELKKWNIYVDLSNELETTFQPAMNAYFAAYGHGAEYKLTESAMELEAFRQTMGTPDQLAKLAEEAWKLATPKDPAQEPNKNSSNDLDKAVIELLAQFRTLWENLVEASKKIPTVGSNPTDGTTPAPTDVDPKVLHSKIYESYHNFIATHRNFQTILSQAALTRRKRDIQEMKQDGLILRSAMLNLIDAGQTLQNNLNSRNITSITLGVADPNDLLPLFASFQRSVEEFDSSLSDPKQLDREKLKLASLEMFKQQLTIVKASATSLVARLKLQTAGEPFSDKTPGTPEHFARELGTLVDKYNSIVE